MADGGAAPAQTVDAAISGKVSIVLEILRQAVLADEKVLSSRSRSSRSLSWRRRSTSRRRGPARARTGGWRASTTCASTAPSTPTSATA